MDDDLVKTIFGLSCGAALLLLMLCYCAVACPPEGTPLPRAVDELPEVVQKLWFGKALYSQSFLLDYWMAIRNKHVLFSVFFAHPLHPFSKLERLLVLISVSLFAYGIASLAAQAFEEILKVLPEQTVADWYRISNLSLAVDELGGDLG